VRTRNRDYVGGASHYASSRSSDRKPVPALNWANGTRGFGGLRAKAPAPIDAMLVSGAILVAEVGAVIILVLLREVEART
jgi:hypothetical protein